jgi:hypothetical protein
VFIARASLGIKHSTARRAEQRPVTLIQIRGGSVTAPSKPDGPEPPLLEILPGPGDDEDDEEERYPPGLTDEQKLRIEIFWMLAPLEYASSEKQKDAVWWEGFIRNSASEPPRNIRQVK